MCKCTCVPISIEDEAPPRPRYNVSANKSVYISESFDELGDATARLLELAAEGYPQVIIRDHEAEGDIW